MLRHVFLFFWSEPLWICSSLAQCVVVLHLLLRSSRNYLANEVLEMRTVWIDVWLQGVVCERFPWRLIALHVERVLHGAFMAYGTTGHQRHAPHVHNVLQLSAILTCTKKNHRGQIMSTVRTESVRFLVKLACASA